MKNRERRLDEVAEKLTRPERIRAVLTAMSEDSQTTIAQLYETAPVFSYDATDLSFSKTITAVEIFSLRVDRTFFYHEARRWKAFAHMDHEWRDPEEPEPEGWKEDPLHILLDEMVLVRSCEVFAERVGLKVAQLLAFSTACDSKEWRHACEMITECGEPEPLGLLANRIVEHFEAFWTNYGGQSCRAT
jgi:hypothetical protein